MGGEPGDRQLGLPGPLVGYMPQSIRQARCFFCCWLCFGSFGWIYATVDQAGFIGYGWDDYVSWLLVDFPKALLFCCLHWFDVLQSLSCVDKDAEDGFLYVFH